MVDEDIVEVAGLAHDLGHPPFGHNGEEALDECMRSNGGFEGNAQTLRILSKLEKKVASTDGATGKKLTLVREGKDQRYGLNLTARVLAAVLKYDYRIPIKAEDRIEKFKKRAPKGYYDSEGGLVEFIKRSTLAGRVLPEGKKFKTVECQIMDIADDIAYSTYDIEDAFKAKFLHPLKLISFGGDFYSEIAADVEKKIQERPEYDIKDRKTFTGEDAILIIVDMFQNIFPDDVDGPLFAAAGMVNMASEAAAEPRVSNRSDRSASRATNGMPG